jgi:hypothetical protein
MRLVEPARAARDYQPYIVPEIQADELADQEETSRVDDGVLDDAEAIAEPAPPLETDDALVEEEFYSPEEDTLAEIPPPLEPEVTALSEPAAVEPPSAEVSAASATEPSQQSTEQRPRPGKSKRRRGRKRNRGGKPGNEGG